MPSSNSVPEGFEPLDTNSPFNRNVGPLFCQLKDSEFIFGLRVEEHHCNSSGRLHGAMMCAICDVAIGHNIGLALAERGVYDGLKHAGAPGAAIHTISMSTDFVGSAKLGDWVEVKTDVQRAGRSIAFANAYLILNGERIARSSAVFKVKGT